MKTQAFALLLVLFPGAIAIPALAVDDTPPPAPAAAPVAPPPAPSSAEIKRVVDYYLRGKDSGPVVMDFVACKKTSKNAEGKLSCDEVLGEKAKKGDPLIAFVRFVVPKGAKYEDLKVKFLANGEVRSTTDFTLGEAFSGYSTYKQTTASKTGTWEMQVLRGDTVVASQKVTVE